MYILSINSVLLENPVYFSGDSQPQWLSWAQSWDAQLALGNSVGDYVAESPLLGRGTEGGKGPSFLMGIILPSLAGNHILSTRQGRGGVAMLLTQPIWHLSASEFVIMKEQTCVLLFVVSIFVSACGVHVCVHACARVCFTCM